VRMGKNTYDRSKFSNYFVLSTEFALTKPIEIIIKQQQERLLSGLRLGLRSVISSSHTGPTEGGYQQ
jgi:hypothetical protein